VTASVAARMGVVDALLADPPAVHPMDDSADPTIGVWSTEEACYRFLAEHCPPGTRTLEVGCGLSTVLFAALGAQHRCVTPGLAERDRIVAYCKEHDIDTERVVFDVESSHAALPRLQRELDGLDLVLIDGGHGFPLPIVDWFYAAPLLVPGGVLIVDDIGLPAVKLLVRFLDADPRWEQRARTDKWAAWRRHDDSDMVEDWYEQPFFTVHDTGVRAFARRVTAGATHRARRLAKRVRGGR